MADQFAALWRHPIKGHGREALETVDLTEGRTMPWDRRWAVAHEAAKGRRYGMGALRQLFARFQGCPR